MTVSWTNTAPTVDSWSEYKDTEAYTYNPDSNTKSQAYVRCRIGRISGTRDVVVHFNAQGKRDSSFSQSYVKITPRVCVDETWYNRSSAIGETTKNGSYHSIGNAYAVISGGNSRTTYAGGYKEKTSSGAVKSLNNPLNGPLVYVNLGGTYIEADVVYVNVNGTWVEADSLFVNVSGEWKEA